MPKFLPQNLEAEQALLGTIIVYPGVINTCFESGLETMDFYSENHQKIYENMFELKKESKPCDFTTMVSRLQDKGSLDKIGGMEYLSQLTDLATSSLSVKHHIELIQEKSLLRRLINTSEQIRLDSYENSFDADTVLNNAERLILDVVRSRKTSEFRTSSEVVTTVIERIEKVAENKGQPTGVPTGYKKLDKTTSGFQGGDLIILAARPGVGKTAFALNVAMNAAQRIKQPVAIFSLEMPAEQLLTRMLSAKAQVNGSQLKNAYLNRSEWMALNEAAMELKETPLFIDDASTIKVSDIFAKCRKLQSEKGLGLIIIDYLQLISGSKTRNENRQQEVSEISRNLKALARDLKVPVIALSQLSRLVEQQRKGEEQRKPQLSDLRESGAIEQDADIVMFLSSKDTKDKDPVPEGQSIEVDLIIAKHRNGATRDLKLAFTKSYSAFYDIVDDVTKKEISNEK
jgi:replicative DNA helicase